MTSTPASGRPLRVATRGSALALWQVDHFADQLGIEVEKVIIKTEGDRTQAANVPIEQMRGQGVFVKEVQRAVLAGEVDFAVHSAKDLPSTVEPGLTIASVVERGDARDVLIGKNLDELPQGGVVGTGSVRRRAQMASLRPDLRFETLRGNIGTRLKKSEEFDCIVMAYAGIVRLGRENDYPLHFLEPEVMLPQVAQGALAAECREDDHELIGLLSSVEHAVTRRAVDAERAFLAELGGSCDLPVGAYAEIVDDQVWLRTLLSSLDGQTVLRREGTASDGVALGRELADLLVNTDGGAQLLAERDNRD